MLQENKPEEKLAQRFFKRKKLSIPVNIEKIILEYADVEYDDLPGNVDAIFMERTNRPLIIIDQSKPMVRKRFTLAHELGHIVIPWHVGTLSCHTDGYQKFHDFYYKKIEAEANRFASELLVPSEWVKELLGVKSIKVHEVIRDIALTCEVSLITSTIAVCKKLPPGYLVIIAMDNKILYHSISPGTKINFKSDEFDIEHINNLIPLSGKIENENYCIYCWDCSINVKDTQPDSVDVRRSKDILKEIVNDTFPDKEEGLKVTRVINGIFGSLNSRLKDKNKDFESYLFEFQQRLIGYKNLAELVKHPKFKQYVSRKISELVSK